MGLFDAEKNPSGYAQKAEVVVFTPASHAGVPICVDPVPQPLDSLQGRERTRAVSGTAQMLVGLLGYESDTDDAAGLAAAFDALLTQELQAGTMPQDLGEFSSLVGALDDERLQTLERFVALRTLAQAKRRLARLDVGVRRLLFHDGVPLDIDILLGRGEESDKTRISLIYLNSLQDQNDKEYLLAALSEALYRWMLEHPSPTPQALFYVDEIAPFLPPVRMPACKPALSMLLKQARKYGVSCLMATQNPGDVDYKAPGQFGTRAQGRLTTRQDIKKVQPTIQSLAPDEADSIVESRPGRGPGEFTLLSPDYVGAPRTLYTRRLHSEHVTLGEDRIEEVTPPGDQSAPTQSPPPRRTDNHDAGAALVAVSGKNVASTNALSTKALAADIEPDAPVASQPLTSKARDISGGGQEQRDDALLPEARTLARRQTMDANDLAQVSGYGVSKGRRVLRALTDAGLAHVYRDGRTQR